MSKKKRNKNETDIAGHRRVKNELQPPLAQIGATHTSWLNDRMPDMLWAVLAIDAWPRETTLDFYRHVIRFVGDHPAAYDITMSGIGAASPQLRQQLIDHMCRWRKDVAATLRPVTLFPELPGPTEWRLQVGPPEPQQDWQRLAAALPQVFDHQSQEATDCRWVKLACEIAGGRLHFPIEMKEQVEELMDYPHRGDMRGVRPFIRAGEMAMPNAPTASRWSAHFWDYSFDTTGCVPEEKTLRVSKAALTAERATATAHYRQELVRVSHALFEHAIATAKTSAVDARYEASFGLAMYARTLFTELLAYGLSRAVVGRHLLRSLVEVQITLAYLLHKDSHDTWMGYRSYGAGQAKLAYLKHEELADQPTSIDTTVLQHIANEDLWQEFVVMKIGHWDASDLRRMSEDAGVKAEYDKFYTWTSGYAHATWMGVRDVAYENCVNPLHRLHRVPVFSMPVLTSVLADSVTLVNNVLTLLDRAYPTFVERIANTPSALDLAGEAASQPPTETGQKPPESA